MKSFFLFSFLVSFLHFSAVSSAEEVKFTTFDGHILSGIWTAGEKMTKGAVLILQGSGNVSADGDVSSDLIGHSYHGLPAKLSEQIATALSAKGIASFRYSKRGVEEASELPHQVIGYLVKDAVSALEVVRSKSDTPVGIVGFSEGAILASLVLQDHPVDALYLVSYPTRAIDDVFGYQFYEWPMHLILNKMHAQRTGIISESSLAANASATLPLIGAGFGILDLNQDHQISVNLELVPAYQKFYSNIRGLLQTPALSGWYESLKTVPSIWELGANLKTDSIYAYAAKNDPQVNWHWIHEDASAFAVTPVIRDFDGVGHCYSPAEGTIGEIKTSGPMNQNFLEQLSKDVEAGLTH